MTNKERRAEWMTVADWFDNNGYSLLAEGARVEANRRFPVKMVTEAMRAHSDTEVRAVVDGDGKRVIQYRIKTSPEWHTYGTTELNAALVAACTAPLHEEEEQINGCGSLHQAHYGCGIRRA